MFILMLFSNHYGSRLFHLLSLMEDVYYEGSQRDVPCLMIRGVQLYYGYYVLLAAL
jgi:hypothetical protein